MADVERFVASIRDDYLVCIFSRYQRGCYDHLLAYARRPVTLKDKRDALTQYLTYFLVAKADEDDERTTTLTSFVQRGAWGEFMQHLQCDQFYEEPLMHTLHQGTSNYILRPEPFVA